MRFSQRGFTLIELLVVIVVIGILATVAMARLQTVREKAFFATVTSDLKTLSIEQELYYQINMAYTLDVADLEFEPSSAVTLTLSHADAAGWAATATHSGLRGDQCGIFQGSAPAGSGDPATVAGIVACTE